MKSSQQEILINHAAKDLYKIVLDIEKKKINKGVLKYISAKLKRLSEKYNTEEIWNDTLDLFNEKEYGTNEIEIQLGYIVNPSVSNIFLMTPDT